ncbi:MAG: TldD/PmbA family protein [Pseudanabaenaceae cyanobacterium]
MDYESVFWVLSNRLFEHLRTGEHLTVSFSGESSQFTRFNRARVRQTGKVEDAQLTVTLMWEEREIYGSFPLTGNLEQDTAVGLETLEELREEIPSLPINPYLVLPENCGSTHEVYQGQLLSMDETVAAILEPVQDCDLVGLYASGQIMRGNANSAGQRHWFSTENFCWDYSLFTTSPDGTELAVKGVYANSVWYEDEYLAQMERSLVQLSALNRPRQQLDRGTYRTYFAPAAVAELLSLITWSVGEASLQQGSSALRKLWLGSAQLSPLFSLTEDFTQGNVPRFNELGEVAPLELPVIAAGQLVNTLVSARSAKEYGKPANGASRSEGMRSPVMAGGKLSNGDILTTLDRGLYLSNLHYLNWSDLPNGRITGMTRYACFWVEKGELIAPIENLRFDDSIYDFLGENLEALTTTTEFIPHTDTYGQRSLGGITVPGMLVKEFDFTL